MQIDRKQVYWDSRKGFRNNSSWTLKLKVNLLSTSQYRNPAGSDSLISMSVLK